MDNVFSVKSSHAKMDFTKKEWLVKNVIIIVKNVLNVYKVKLIKCIFIKMESVMYAWKVTIF